jgi:hypothetical protein
MIDNSSFWSVYGRAFKYVTLTITTLCLFTVIWIFGFDYIEVKYGLVVNNTLKSIFALVIYYLLIVVFFSPAVKEFKRIHDNKLNK